MLLYNFDFLDTVSWFIDRRINVTFEKYFTYMTDPGQWFAGIGVTLSLYMMDRCWSKTSIDWGSFGERTLTNRCLLSTWESNVLIFLLILFFGLNQGSQTRCPWEGPMRPANIKKNKILIQNLKLFGLFFLQTLIFASIFFFQCGPKTLIWVSCSLWVWDPWLKSTLAKYWEGNVGPRRWKQKWKWLGSL